MPELEILHASSITNDVIVVVNDGKRKLNGTVPRELLDDEVGDDADMSKRKSWINTNSSELARAMVSKADGGITRKPFNRIIFQGEG